MTEKLSVIIKYNSKALHLQQSLNTFNNLE